MYKNYGNGSKIDEKATENAPKQINEYKNWDKIRSK